MKNIIQSIKDFKYKTTVAIILLALTQILNYFLNSDFLWYTGIVLFAYIVFVIYRLMFYGIKNLYTKDNEKTLAITFGVIASVFTIFVIYLLISNLL